MLPKVLLFSALIIGAAAYPLVFGPIDLRLGSSAAPEEVAARTEPPTVAFAETSSGGTVELQHDDRGHFFGEFRLNGRKAQAMVDTGATVVAINKSMARRIGLALRDSDFTRPVNTANGMVSAAPVILQSVEVGRIRIRNVNAVVIQDDALSTVLIGMSFLSKLDSFKVRNGKMVLDH